MFPFLESRKLLVAGVSGGPDSLTLLHLLHQAGYPLLVASFDHRLRPASGADVLHVQRIAAALGLPFVTDSADAAAHARDAGLSLEEAARHLRYRFLFRAARRAGAQAVAVGHTADDQAETVLMHFLRGAGLTGLKGMPPRSLLPVFDPEIPLVRPLLGWTRAQTENYCRENNLPALKDPTNADTTYLRNRLRHELLPQLETYNPQIRQTLAKTAAALQGDAELLNQLTDSAWQQTIRAVESGFVAFDLPQLRELPPALRRNLFRRAIFTLKPGLRDADFDALEKACTLKAVEVAGGLKTLIEAEVLYLTEDESALPAAKWPQIRQPYKVTGSPLDLENGWSLTCELIPPPASFVTPDPFSAFFDADLTEGRLRVRPCRAGDRFEPLGMPRQTIKLSDLFVNLKIPKRLRPHWPVLCVEEEIAWVPGLRMGHHYRCTESTRHVLAVRIKRPTNV